MKTFLTLITILAATCVWSAASPRFDEISEVKIEYWKWTAGRTVSYWDVVFSAEEIKPLQDILKRAKRVGSEEVAWFITSLKGTLKTAEGDYQLSMGDEKIARQTYRISITPILESDSSKSVHFHLSNTDGKEFQEIVGRLITPKIARKPDRVEIHK